MGHTGDVVDDDDADGSSVGCRCLSRCVRVHGTVLVEVEFPRVVSQVFFSRGRLTGIESSGPSFIV